MKRVLIPFLIYICIALGFLIGASPSSPAENNQADSMQIAAAYAYEAEEIASVPEPTPEPLPYDPALPMLALTFDDGPGPSTETILDLLEEYGARATFCVIGYLVEANSGVIQRIAEQGSELVSHTWEHTDLRNMNADDIRSDMFDVAGAIAGITDECPKFVRPPYGGINEKVKGVYEELGIGILMWSVDTEDWQTQDADATYEAIIAGARDGAVILCHDSHPSTGEAMRRAIPELIKMGYQLVTVSELITSRAGAIEGGEEYRYLPAE